MVNTPEVKQEKNDTQSIDQQLSKEVLDVAKKVDDHLSDLEKIIKDGIADKDIEKKHKAIELEINTLVGKITDEKKLDDNARSALHGLKERISAGEASLDEAKEETFENSTLAGKVAILTDKYGLKASIAVAVLKWVWEVRQEMKKGKGFRGKTRGLIKWIFWGLIWWGLTYLWTSAVNYIASTIDDLDPRNAAKKAMHDVKWRFARLLGFNKKENDGERYDPQNQFVQDARNDSDLESPGFEWPEMWMDELDRPIFGWKDGRTEVGVIPGDIGIAEVYRKDQVDALYNDPVFADKYLLFCDAVNMWTQAARNKDQSGWLLSTKDSGIASIQIIEQELLKVQQNVQQSAPKEQILADISSVLQHIQRFEMEQKWVIGEERWKVVRPSIEKYSTNELMRETDFERAQLSIYDGFRKIWWKGDSNVVKRNLYDDLLHRSKYEKLDEIFDGEMWEKVFDMLAKIDPTSKNDPELTTLITKHLSAAGLLESPDKKKPGLKEAEVYQITKSLIQTYNSAKKQIDSNEKEFKKYFTRAYWLEIDTNKAQQGKMASAYEQMYGIGTLKQYAQQKNLAYSGEDKWKVVRSFAWEVMKSNSLHAAVMWAYEDIFFDRYLPTQQVISGTRTISSGTWSQWTTVNEYRYNDKKEALLADVIWAGEDFSDQTVSASIDMWINLAASLIPVIGTEFAAARIAGGLLARWILASGTSFRARAAIFWVRAIIWHTAMTTFVGITNEKPCNEIFEDLFDIREFAQNAVFFNVVGQVGPWISKNVWRIRLWAKVNAAALEGLSTHRMWRLAIMTGSGLAETVAIETTRKICDPHFERSWGEVLTVLMMSTILAGKVGNKAKEYTAVKSPDGKIKLTRVPPKRIMLEIEWPTTNKQVWGKIEERVNSTPDGNVTVMWETITKKTINNKTTYTLQDWTTTFASSQELVASLRLKRFGEKPTFEHVWQAWSEELVARIDDAVATGKTFTKWEKTYKFEADKSWEIQVLVKTEKWFAPLTESEVISLTWASEELAVNVSKKIIDKADRSKKTVGDMLKSGKITSQEFGARCKEHNISWTERLLVWDFFRLIGEKKIGKLLFSEMTKFKWLTHTEALIPTKLIRRTYLLGKNAAPLFNVGSIIYGLKVWDNGEKGWDEAMENYFLYSILWRWLIGKAILATMDYNDIVF